MEVPGVRRVEGAAVEADAQAGRMRGGSPPEGSGPSARPSRSRLPGAADPVLEGGELLDADRAAGVHAAGGDADLGAEAELAAVGELGRGVVQDDRRIDLGEEALGRRRIRR